MHVTGIRQGDGEEGKNTHPLGLIPLTLLRINQTPKGRRSIMTNKQKQAIRAHWPNMQLVFKKDGTVLARKSKGGALGLLYTQRQLAAHLATLKN